jgi:hypothetical protein
MISGTLAHAIVMLYVIILLCTANDIPTSSAPILDFKRWMHDDPAISVRINVTGGVTVSSWNERGSEGVVFLVREFGFERHFDGVIGKMELGVICIFFSFLDRFGVFALYFHSMLARNDVAVGYGLVFSGLAVEFGRWCIG